MGAPFDPDTTFKAENVINLSERDATPSNDAGKLVQLEDDGYLSKQWLRFVQQLTTFDVMDGSTTPKAAVLSPNGNVTLADANVTGRDSFIGFVKSDESGNTLIPSYLATSGDGGSFANSTRTASITVPAGSDVYLVVNIVSFTTATFPTSVEWDGTAMTKLGEVTSGPNSMTVWGLALGDVASNTTANIELIGGTTPGNNTHGYAAAAYVDVDQTTPVSSGSFDSSSGVNPGTSEISAAQGYALFIGASCDASLDSPVTVRQSGLNSSAIGDVSGRFGLSIGAGSGTDVLVAGFALNSAQTPNDVDVFYTDIVDGFSGLTPGETYYLSDTEGEISTTPGTTSVRIGKAISATELLITH